jgi:acyl-CoA synthetase (AMP-forming)/AMP-acid ligase II
VFRNGWVYPGDVGSEAEQGLVTLGGRSTEVINSGGNKVNPTVIEDVLKSFPGVRDAAAFGVPDALGNAHVSARGSADPPASPAIRSPAVALHHRGVTLQHVDETAPRAVAGTPSAGACECEASCVDSCVKGDTWRPISRSTRSSSNAPWR